jgi:HEAT repeat protein
MSIRRGLAAATLLVLLPGAAAAQPPPDAAPSAATRASTLGKGWAAIAAGRPADAVRAADELLKRNPADHQAAALGIEALAPGKTLAALDAYERWLAHVAGEDVHLLQPIAEETLRALAHGTDRALQVRALDQLARAGDAAAAGALAELGRTGGPQVDAARARLGDAAAAARLIDGSAGGVPPQAVADALGAAGPAAAPRLLELLKHREPSVRRAAAMSLGKAGAANASEPLKALAATDETIRPWATVALARLGDTEALAAVEQMLASPVADIRLLAAEAYAGKPSGPWVEALTPLLDDRNGLTRVRAAELLAPAAPERARDTLLQALSDPNPVVRGDVARALDESDLLTGAAPGDTLPVLRRMLRDADPSVRLHAAASVLRLSNSR